MKIRVPKKFITMRNERALKYNAHGRSKSRLLRDIECEFYEYSKLMNGEWKDDDNWQIDGHTKEYGPVDVKCITRFYNISRQKFLYLLQQEQWINYFYFIEWKSRPDRVLKTGDEIEFTELGAISYKETIKNVKVSFKGDGYYVNARQILSKREGSPDRFCVSNIQL